jgi:hypothetical protein
MKKLHLLYILALSLLLFQTSCKKDDDPAPNPLIGEWELDRVNLDFPTAYNSSDGNYPPTFFFDIYKITFKADNTFMLEVSAGSPIQELEGDWKLNGKEVTLDFDGSSDSETYTLNEDNTTMTGESSNATFEIGDQDVTAAVRLILKKEN